MSGALVLLLHPLEGSEASKGVPNISLPGACAAVWRQSMFLGARQRASVSRRGQTRAPVVNKCGTLAPESRGLFSQEPIQL